MWSLGVILFALLCGHLPFDDENMKDLYKKIANGTYRCPAYVMPNAKHLISRLITVDPKRRATMREVFSHPWVNEGFLSQPEETYIQPSPIKHIHDLSQDIVDRLVVFGYSKEEIITAFENHQENSSPNPIRSTYFLVKDMVDREQSLSNGKNPALHNGFFREKESSTLTLVSTSDHTLLSTSSTHIPVKTSNEVLQPPPGAHVSQRTHSVKVPALDMDLMEFNPYKPSSSNSNRNASDLNPTGIFGFSLAQVAESQIQKLYTVPASIYNYVSETTNTLLSKAQHISQQCDTPQHSKEKKEPVAIVNDVIRVLSGTDARWHFESKFKIICEMDANSYLPADANEMDIDQQVCRNQSTKQTGPKVVTFSIEVGKNPNNHYGVFFRRLHGGVWNYKRICTKLVQMMKL